MNAQMDESTREYHPAANIFPLLQGRDYEALKADIASNGLMEAIWLTEDGRILDGRNRHRACIELDIAPQFRTYTGDSPLAFAVSLNLARRHLTSSQAAALSLDVMPMLEEEARARHRELAGRPSSNGGNIATVSDRGKARDHAAKMLKTSPRYVQDAKTIKEHAPELLDDIRAGTLSIPYAMRKVGAIKASQRRKARDMASAPSATAPRLMVGDAQAIDLPDCSVDVIITSPPYNLGEAETWPMGGHGREGRNGIGYSDAMSDELYRQWQVSVLDELYRVTKPGGSLFYNHKTRTQDGVLIHPMAWLSRVDRWTLRQEIIWDREVTHNHSATLFWPIDERIYWFTKGKPALYGDSIGMPSVWRFHGPQPHTWHPAPFSEGLPRRCLQAIGGRELVVLDPFAGSCTTLKVAYEMGHTAIGVDISDEYLERAKGDYGW
jgi:modification methylase